MTIANPYPFNLNFLVHSRNCSMIKTRIIQNSNNGMPLSTSLNPISVPICHFKIRDVQIGGVASVSSVKLPAVSHSDRHLRSCGNSSRFSGSSLLLLRRSSSPSLWICMMSHTTEPPESTKTVNFLSPLILSSGLFCGMLKLKILVWVRCVIKGRVQGVFYRKWTVENATQLGLKGWVRNKRDGSVEAVFSGKAEFVDEMQERCRRGPPDATVTGFQVFPYSDDPGTGFQLKPTT